MKRIWQCLTLVLAVTLLFNCEHKELCIEHPHLVPVRVDAEWDQFCELPMNMTVLFFPKDGSEVITVENHNPRSAYARLAVNTYDVLVFNELANELGGIKFRNMNQLSTAEAYAYHILEQKRMKNSTDEPLVADPERLGIAIVRDFEVTKEMLETYWYQRDMGLQIEDNVLKVYPENVIYVVDIKVHVNGIKYVRSVESTLSGMAEGQLLDSGNPTTNRVTHLLTNWSTVSTSETDPNAGYLHATCLSFGLPADHIGEAIQNILNMSVRLVDNQTVIDLSYLVGNRFRKDQWDCSPVLYLEFGKPYIDDPNPEPEPDPEPDPDPDPDPKPDPDPDPKPDPDPDPKPDPDPDPKPDPDPDPDKPGYDDPDDPIVFPEVKPEGTMDGGLTIDPGFDGDHSVELKGILKDKKKLNKYINQFKNKLL